jgi:hypothetical protein
VVERVEKEDGMHPLYMAYLPPQDYLLVFFFSSFYFLPLSLSLSLSSKNNSSSNLLSLHSFGVLKTKGGPIHPHSPY